MATDKLGYFLADPMGRGKHDPSIRIPQPGDHIKVKDSWLRSTKHGYSSDDIVRLAREEFQVIEDVSPIVTGQDGNYVYNYSCYLKGYDFMICNWCFDFIN